MTVRELLSGIGEAHSAYNLMLRLRRAGVDAAFVDLTGWRGSESVTLDRRIAEALAPLDLSRQLPIVTGYAQCEEGQIGRASCRERVCQYVSLSVVDVYLKKKATSSK